VSPKTAREDYLARGMMEQAAETLLKYFDEAVDGILRHLGESVGRVAPVTSTVQDVTGRPTRTFAEWAAENSAASRDEYSG
jgi:hypothetical protein